MSWVLVVRFVPSWACHVFLVQELELACFQALHCLATVLHGVTGVSMFSDICGSSTVSDTGSKLTDIFCNYILFFIQEVTRKNNTEANVATSHVYRLIVCIAKVEINRS